MSREDLKGTMGSGEGAREEREDGGQGLPKGRLAV